MANSILYVSFCINNDFRYRVLLQSKILSKESMKFKQHSNTSHARRPDDDGLLKNEIFETNTSKRVVQMPKYFMRGNI